MIELCGSGSLRVSEVVDPGTVIGSVTTKAAEETGSCAGRRW